METSRPTILAVDIASGGVSASLVDSDLRPLHSTEVGWQFVTDQKGRETLSASFVWEQTSEAIRRCISGMDPPGAIALSSMMHTLLLTDRGGVPQSPVYAWMDTDSPELDAAEGRILGEDYRQRTGAYFHSSFPAYKLARLSNESPGFLRRGKQAVSVKAYVGAQLTGNWVEDVSTASASGLLNLHTGEWDQETLKALRIDESNLPRVVKTTDSIGSLTEAAAGLLDLQAGIRVIAGGGDGFLATLGSGCETPDRTAITVGTTASVRRFSPTFRDNNQRGTFCYRYSPDSFLVGAASNNGGNVLDWAREELGVTSFDGDAKEDEPWLFFPHVRGERTPFWDSGKEARWRFPGQNGKDRNPNLGGRSVVEGLAFQLGMYFEWVGEVFGQVSERSVLSGNAFHTEELAPILTAVIPGPVIEPATPGLATLRGAARCGFEALGIETREAVELLLEEGRTVEPDRDEGVRERYGRFKDAYFDE